MENLDRNLAIVVTEGRIFVGTSVPDQVAATEATEAMGGVCLEVFSFRKIALLPQL